MKCAFCDSKEIKERVVIKNELAFVFPTNIPIVPGHLLISPIRYARTFEDLTDEECLSIFDLLKKTKIALKKTFGAEGFNCAWNEAEVAGQSVPHFHLHVLPRKTGDTGITEHEPRKFLYWRGGREVSPEVELHAISQEIRNNL